jgi:hypothetical protein
LKWPSTIVANPSVGGLSARTAFFFGSGSSMESRGFFIVVPFAFTAIIWICVEAGCKNHGWRVVIRVSVTAELPLENECYGDQETENAQHQYWRHQPLSQIEGR